MGDWFAEKWDQATEAGKAAAIAVYDGAAAAAQATKDAAVVAAQAARDAAVAAAEAAKDAAIAAAEATKAAAIAAAEAAKRAADAADTALRNAARNAEHAVVDAGSKVVAAGNSGARWAGDRVDDVQEGVAKVKDGAKGVLEKLGMEFDDTPVAAPVAPCTDCMNDGDFIIINSAGDCESVPPGSTPAETQAAIAQAKSSTKASDSPCCRQKPAAQRNKTQYYTNGIGTDADSHCSTLKKLAKVSCSKVVGVFNDTEGALKDAGRTADARQFLRDEMNGEEVRSYSGFSPSVSTIQKTMEIELLSGNEFNIIAHSEGGANTSLATNRAAQSLKGSGDGGLVENANITSMGSAAPVWADGPNYNHYIHVNDTTPNVLGLGDSDRNGGTGSQVHRFGGSSGGGFTDNPVKRPYAPTSPVRDHSINDSYLDYYNAKEGGCG